MGNLLKYIYSSDFYDKFSETLQETVPSFSKAKFIKLIFDSNWDKRELKERMKHTSNVLHSFFPHNFAKAAKLINKIIEHLQKRNVRETSIEFMFFPDYIETYGLNDYETSVELMEFVTQFSSCEFAVRPFIIKYGDKMLQHMQQWSLHSNHRVRRLASEGSRPRLPWANALPELKKNPVSILPILENLKNDPSEFVRRSVANNLNDISKDNPNIVIAFAHLWKGHSKETDAIIKHASRTLLKQGNPVILKYFGLVDSAKIVISKFKIHTPKVKFGGSLVFSFSLQNTGKKIQVLRIEYAIYYLRGKGQYAKKVFKISERQIKPGAKIDIDRKQMFKLITKRKIYAGQHKLSLIINGQVKKIGKFKITDS